MMNSNNRSVQEPSPSTKRQKTSTNMSKNKEMKEENAHTIDDLNEERLDEIKQDQAKLENFVRSIQTVVDDVKAGRSQMTFEIFELGGLLERAKSHLKALQELTGKSQEFENKKQAALIKKQAALIKKKDALIKKKDALIKKKDALTEQQAALIKKKDALIEQQSLQCLRHQPISFVDRTASQPHIPETHDPAVVEEVGDLFGNNNLHPPDSVWKAAFIRNKDKEISVHSESDVVHVVNSIVSSVLDGLGLKDLIRMAQNRQIAGIECDIVLLYGTQFIPFAVIEIKKPGPTEQEWEKMIFSSKDDVSVSNEKARGSVAGQHYDQLSTLELMGFGPVYGMITNGNYWAITTRGDPDAAMNHKSSESWTDLATKLRSYASKAKGCYSPERMELQFDEGAYSSGSPVDRRLKRSPLVKSIESDQLVGLVANFIRLACQTLSTNKCKPVLKLVNMSCRALNLRSIKDGGAMRCSFLKRSWKKIELTSTVPFERVRTIYLIYHLGGGMNGDCCLGVTGDGKHCCAVKFFLKDEGRTGLEQAKAESKNWKSVYPEMLCHVGTLPNDDGYLCMPYLKPIGQDMRGVMLDNGDVKKALEEFSKTGYLHQDIAWRHLGQYDGNKLLFCDLGNIEECQNEMARKMWLERSLARFRGHLLSTPVGKDIPFGDDDSPGAVQEISVKSSHNIIEASKRPRVS